MKRAKCQFVDLPFLTIADLRTAHLQVLTTDANPQDFNACEGDTELSGKRTGVTTKPTFGEYL